MTAEKVTVRTAAQLLADAQSAAASAADVVRQLEQRLDDGDTTVTGVQLAAAVADERRARMLVKPAERAALLEADELAAEQVEATRASALEAYAASCASIGAAAKMASEAVRRLAEMCVMHEQLVDEIYHATYSDPATTSLGLAAYRPAVVAGVGIYHADPNAVVADVARRALNKLAVPPAALANLATLNGELAEGASAPFT